MSGLQNLRCLAQGGRPANDGLLDNARLGWGGLELVSEEVILAAFVAQPFALEDTLEIETPCCAALIGESEALFADLYDGRIGRVWRVGSVPPRSLEPAVDVAFDIDMRQKRGDLAFNVEDHLSLDPAAADNLVEQGRELVGRLRGQGNFRVRGFVTRAGGTAANSVALVAVYTLSDEPSRSASFRHAVIGLCQGQEPRTVEDPERAQRWNPRL